MYLQQSSDDYFHVYTTINKKRFILTHMFINLNGDNTLLPKVEYVDVSGFDEVSKLPIFERVKIG